MDTAERKIRILVAEDDAPVRAYLLKLLEKVEFVEVVGQAEDGEEALNLIDKLQPDLLILDIRMPKMDGFSLLASLEAPPPVIFVTAYDEYAVKAFEVNAIDYILKPISPERLYKALNRAKEYVKQKDLWRSHFNGLLNYVGKAKIVKIAVLEGPNLRVIDMDEIVWIEAKKDYSFVHLKNGLSYKAPKGIGAMEKLLPKDKFMRVHRSYIVNLEEVQSIIPWFGGDYLLKMSDGSEVTVSRRRAKALKERFGL